MSGLLNRVKNIIGIDDELSFEEEEILEEEEEMEDYNNNDTAFRKKNNKVVNIHTQNSAKIILLKTNDFEDVREVCDNFKNRKIVVINTVDMDLKQAQRMLDFMGGAAYVLNGELVQIEKSVYMLSPSNVEVTNELKTELGNRGFFSKINR